MKRLFYKHIHYKTVQIQTQPGIEPKTSILVIYTGGTLGMVHDENQSLIPFDFELVLERMPELRNLGVELTVIAFNQLIDSANVMPAHWIALATLIEENYNRYNGFVIIHGTDTMAYSASALSYLLEDLNKPVIFTGAQLPIGAVRTDARENLVTALEIAAARKDGRPYVPEVCIYFGNLLLRGNRSKKIESSQFGAFESRNYPALAESGIRIQYNNTYIKPYQPFSGLKVYKKMDPRVSVLKFFPGISREAIFNAVRIPSLKALVIETYGSGNAPTEGWIVDNLKWAIDSGVIVYNVSQCYGGTVMQGRYETSKALAEIGVLSGGDITVEAALTKLMFLLANSDSMEQVKRNLVRPIRGEMS